MDIGNWFEIYVKQKLRKLFRRIDKAITDFFTRLVAWYEEKKKGVKDWISGLFKD